MGVVWCDVARVFNKYPVDKCYFNTNFGAIALVLIDGCAHTLVHIGSAGSQIQTVRVYISNEVWFHI